MDNNKKLEDLQIRLREISAINNAMYVLSWDQMTYMPPGGAAARGYQMAVLAKIAQEKLINPEVGRLLDELHPYEESLPYEDDDASLIRIARRDYERATRIPPEFTARFNEHISKSYQVWTEARPANDFGKIQPHLEKSIDLSREMANFFPGYQHIADPLIDISDYGMKAETVRALFADLRAQLVPVAQAITARAVADDSCLHKIYPEAQQWAFADTMSRQIGYDFKRGRLDRTHHPFTTNFSIGDVRITANIRENFLGDSINIHEAGHGLYEQGSDMKYDGLPLAGGTSAGVHESQSRLWENQVGRSRGFWEFFYPKLQEAFPSQLKGTTLETFYRAVNKVERSLIRVDADEVTYDLHVMVRFELELALLEGSLAVKDLPEAWRERYKSDIGITPPDDKDGVLQDVHWFSGPVAGAFQCYTLGNLMASQFYDMALKAHPEIPDEIRQGKFDTLLAWLIENIYRHGRKYTAPELVRRVTGSDISIDPYIKYLRSKYGELYQL